MSYFKGIKTQAGATKRWRALCKKHHPDVGGDPQVMAKINAEYRETLIRLRTPPAPEPVICEPYVPQERPEPFEPPSAPPLRDLLSEDEKSEVVSSLADTASRVVKASVTAALRRFFGSTG